MPRSVRYQNPIIREHLVSQYVLGTLPPLVKCRLETIMTDDIEFSRQITAWQERLKSMHKLIEPVNPPKEVKQRVFDQLSAESNPKHSSLTSWLDSLRLWKTATAALTVIISVMLFFNTPPPINPTPSYVAMMNVAGSLLEAPLVISGYLKTETEPSKLVFSWNERTDQIDMTGATLWAISRKTGEEFRLGTVPDVGEAWSLTKPQWLAVVDSLHLTIKRGDKTLLTGLCVQIQPWTT